VAMINCAECGNQISSQAAACPKCGAKPKKKTSVFMQVVLGIFGLVVTAAMIGHDKKPTTMQGQPPGVIAPEVHTKTTLDDLTLDFEWEASGFGNIAVIGGTIKNDGPTAVKDLQIKCEGFAASGTKIDTNKRPLYQLVEAGKTVKFSKLNMGFINQQVKSSSCGIVGFTPG
jgi:DNA-directed RNA polymerase subunit RPC12/RpoP